MTDTESSSSQSILDMRSGYRRKRLAEEEIMIQEHHQPSQQQRRVNKESEKNMYEAPKSAIRYVERTTPFRTTREGHLMSLLPLSRREIVDEEEQRQLIEFRVQVELGAFLAFKHFQRRSGSVLPFLPRRLESCDFTWTYEHHDTEFSPLQAAKVLIENTRGGAVGRLQSTASTATATLTPSTAVLEEVTIIADDDTLDAGEDIPIQYEEDELLWGTNDTFSQLNDNTTSYNLTSDFNATNDNSPLTNRRLQQNPPPPPPIRQPFAIMGAARSVVSETLGILGSALDLPQISSSSTSSSLDDLSHFARTVPNNSGDAHVAMAYLNHLGVQHLGVLFIKNVWGRQYATELSIYASQYNITLYSVAYEDEGNLDQAFSQLESSQVRYFYGIINPSQWKPVVRKAVEYGLIGNAQYQWYLADTVELVGKTFELDRSTEWDLAQALHGIGVVFLQVFPHEAFDRAIAVFADSEALQEEFIQLHAEPHLFQNLTFEPYPGYSLFQYLTYDAVIALGLTACDTPGLFTGQEFYDQLLKIDFEGVSGRVRLHNKTGTRLGEGMQYQIYNLVLSDYDSGNVPTSTIPTSPVTFNARPSITVDLSQELLNGPDGTPSLPIFEVNQPFVYYDNSTIPPLMLPPVEENMNLIPGGVLAVGLSLAGLVMLLSIGCAIWTHIYRRESVVRAAQPVFLILVCLGTFIMASTIIPLSAQEPLPGLDAACQATPWCFCLGFTITIAALFSKAHRINKLMNSGSKLRRVEIKPKDVIRPFAILLTINLAFLTAWTASPYKLVWHRVYVNNLDGFGRSVESYGLCRAEGGLMYLVFLVPLALANIIVLLIATVESWKGRKLPSQFSESKFVAVSLISLCETFTLGATTLVAVMENPTAYFLIMSLVLTIACLSILIPLFGPKYLQRNTPEAKGLASGHAIQAYSGMSKWDFNSRRDTPSEFGQNETTSSNLPPPSRMSDSSDDGDKAAFRPSISECDDGGGSTHFLKNPVHTLEVIHQNVNQSLQHIQHSAFFASEPMLIKRASSGSASERKGGSTHSTGSTGGSGHVSRFPGLNNNQSPPSPDHRRTGSGNRFGLGNNQNPPSPVHRRTGSGHRFGLGNKQCPTIATTNNMIPKLGRTSSHDESYKKKILSTLSEHVSFEERLDDDGDDDGDDDKEQDP